MVKDKNAGALDAALQCARVYAAHCGGACSADLAANVAKEIVKGSSFSSRPTTLKLSTALLLKLMEVGADGASSVHSVVGVLLSLGLASRKPKVVSNSASLVLESALAFGAACLPLAEVSNSASKILSHANGEVREFGMNILAEICRSVGSKSAMQKVIDNLKKAQVAQLDSMLESQPSPLPPTVGLRSQRGQQTSGDSGVDVMAALEQGAKELEAKRFASRKAVNLMNEVAKTEYAAKLKLAKWSEKVAALDILINCGGEKPYKLAQPSGP
eukprot:9779964-Ditylum_brightwellii.AAC.1